MEKWRGRWRSKGRVEKWRESGEVKEEWRSGGSKGRVEGEVEK